MSIEKYIRNYESELCWYVHLIRMKMYAGWISFYVNIPALVNSEVDELHMAVSGGNCISTFRFKKL